jgi:hypothetical protein
MSRACAVSTLSRRQRQCNRVAEHRRPRGFSLSGRRASARWLDPRRLFGAGAVLARAHDGGVGHHELVVSVARQGLEYPCEHAAFTPSPVATVRSPPVPVSPRQITPGDGRAHFCRRIPLRLGGVAIRYSTAPAPKCGTMLLGQLHERVLKRGRRSRSCRSAAYSRLSRSIG